MLGTFIFVLFGPGSVVAFMAVFQSPGGTGPNGSIVLSGILFNGSYYQWIYWVGPVLGGISGALSFNLLYGDWREYLTVLLVQMILQDLWNLHLLSQG